MSPRGQEPIGSVVDRQPDRSDELLDMARQARSLYRKAFEGLAPDVVRLPEGAAKELIDALSKTVAHCVQQIVPFSSYQLDDDFSHRVWRGLAQQRGISVERVYVVPPGGDPDGAVTRQLEADIRADAQSRELKLGTIPELGPWGLGTEVPVSEMWIMDGRAVVRRELFDHGPAVWVVSVRPADVQRARSVWDRVWEAAGRSDPPRGEPDLTEPLLESARILHTMAPMSCTRDHVDPDSCSWYHGVWQYLRLFDMVSSPSWHSEFYRTSLSGCLAGEGRRRVLITGAADYSVLAYVIAAAGQHDLVRRGLLDAHVMDLCPTPLNACRWYADRFNLPITVHEADILGDPDALVRDICGNDADKHFDVIVTDAFLTRFCREDAGRALSAWRTLLRPGGSVVTTIRLHPRETRQRGGARTGVPQDLVKFTLRLRERALGWRNLLDVDLEALVREAQAYTLRMSSMDIGDSGDIVELAQRHGFTATCDIGQVSGELVPGVYARLLLTAI